MKRILPIILLACGMAVTVSAFSQVTTTREQILFYTSQWKGERFADGRPKIDDSLLTRALNVSIEDVWDYLQGQGYHCQFDGGWKALHHR